MGSDHSPDVLLKELHSLRLPENVELLGIGTPDLAKNATIPFFSAPDYISMGDNPISAVKKKKGASMIAALRLLKQGKIHALISAGNTGALVLGSKIVLSTLPGIHRPAFLSMMPTKKGPVAVLDLGATIQCKASHLVQFAYLASAYLLAKGVKKPKIGLLNIGEEPIKGTSELRQAYLRLNTLTDPPFKFLGNIEGKSVFEGDADALITDGFTGNVFLKTAEGIANLILDRIHTNLSNETIRSIGSELSDLKKHLHYAEFPGALLIGVKGIVIKCHGYSTPTAFINAIRGAIELISDDFMNKFLNELSENT